MFYESFFSENQFQDIENFPHGFQNTGYFTQMEADVLTRCGYIMKKLSDGKMHPENIQQKRFLDVIRGKTEPLYHIDFVFLKYLKTINNIKIT